MPGSFDSLNPRNRWDDDVDDTEEDSETEREAIQQKSWTDLFKTLIFG